MSNQRVPYTRRRTDIIIGKLALSDGLVNEEQVDEAVEYQQCHLEVTDEMNFGEILVHLGHLSSDQVRELVKAQREGNGSGLYDIRFGAISMINGFINEHDLNDALAEQIDKESVGARIGEILIRDGKMTPQEVNAILKTQGRLKTGHTDTRSINVKEFRQSQEK
ncbi:MAG: hypothetical protein NUW37_06865 [Planctomycetes bacterium]|nr:hypothetical protein [Planctomycetota bacterium]